MAYEWLKVMLAAMPEELPNLKGVFKKFKY